MLTVVATYSTGPGATRGVADLLARHAAASEQEAGCRQFRYIDNTMRDGEGNLRLTPAARPTEEHDDVHPLGVDPG